MATAMQKRSIQPCFLLAHLIPRSCPLRIRHLLRVCVEDLETTMNSLVVVPEAGLEPARSCLRGIFILLRLWTPLLLNVCSLDFLFTFSYRNECFDGMRGSRQVSTLSTFD